MLSTRSSSQNPDKPKQQLEPLLCALEAEDNGFGFILGKKGSPSQMEKLWHGHRQEQHTKATKRAWLTAQLSQVLGVRAEASDPVQQEGKMREPFEALWPMPDLSV